MDINFLNSQISGYGMSLISLIGIVFALYRLYSLKRPSPFWWTIIIVIFPLGWALYLILDFTMLKDEVANKPSETPQQYQQTQQQPVQQYSASAEQNPSITSAESLAVNPEQQYQPVQQTAVQPVQQAQKPVLTGSAKAFKTVGMVLGIITMVMGALVVGAIILFVIAFSSYGSNK